LNKINFKELIKFEGTQTKPFIVDKPFSPADMEYKTPFGFRSGNGETITLTIEQLEAMKSGKLIAVDIEKEYVIFLKLEKCDS
jgi:hypothetical protein